MCILKVYLWHTGGVYQKNFGHKFFLESKFFFRHKIFRQEIFLDPKFFQTQIFFRTQNFFWTKNFLWTQNFFSDPNFLLPKTFFGLKIHFGPTFLSDLNFWFGTIVELLVMGSHEYIFALHVHKHIYQIIEHLCTLKKCKPNVWRHIYRTFCVIFVEHGLNVCFKGIKMDQHSKRVQNY